MAINKLPSFSITAEAIYMQNLVTPSKLSGKYELNLINLDKASVKKLTDAGLKVSDCNRTEGIKRGKYIVLRSSGKYEPRLVDSKHNSIPSGTSFENGTVVKAVVQPYTTAGFAGVFGGFGPIMVIKGEVFKGSSSLELLEVEEGGFTITPDEDDSIGPFGEDDDF